MAYQYPLNMADRYKSRITFQAIKVNRPNVTIRFKASETAKDEDAGVLDKAASVADGIDTGGQGLSVYEIPGQRANLYLPLAFQVNDGFDYQQASLGLLGSAVAGAVNTGGSIGSEVMKSLSEGGKSIMDLFSTGSVSQVAAVRASQAIPLVPDNVRNAISITAGVTMNPNIRTSFNGVAVREFNFNFKFIPRSAEESVEVKTIIKFFRFHAYPEEEFGAKGFSVALKYPDMFKIRLLSEGTDGRFKNVGTPIKLCYLKTISTNYNPTSAVLHPDGSPTEIDLTLTFTEYKPQTRDDIRNEDNNTFYHYENAPVQNEETKYGAL